MKTNLKIIFNFFLIVVWLILIYYLSSIPNLKTDFGNIWDIVLRKGAHVFEYTVLNLLITNAFYSIKSLSKSGIIFLSLFLGLMTALSDEYHQTFVNSRVGSVIDIFVDFLGIILGITLFYAIKFLYGRYFVKK